MELCAHLFITINYSNECEQKWKCFWERKSAVFIHWGYTNTLIWMHIFNIIRMIYNMALWRCLVSQIYFAFQFLTRKEEKKMQKMRRAIIQKLFIYNYIYGRTKRCDTEQNDATFHLDVEYHCIQIIFCIWYAWRHPVI